MRIAGIDVGAVNVKVALCHAEDGRLAVESTSFPFETQELAGEVLRRALGEAADLVVATETVSFSRSMHRTYAAGVEWICDLLERAFGAGRVRFVGLDYQLETIESARRDIWRVACRNWVATAYLVARHLRMIDDGLLVDCGTSSLDIVPIVGGVPRALDGGADRVWTRLGSGELTLTGTLLTSVQSLIPEVPVGERRFSTRSLSPCMVGHARVVAGEIQVRETVPGQSDEMFSPSNSKRLLAELVGADATLVEDDVLQSIAAGILKAQRRQIAERVELVRSQAEQRFDRPFRRLVVAGLGAGTLLVPALSDRSFVLLQLGESPLAGTAPTARLTPNCETALGAALLGLERVRGSTSKEFR